ncbi:MAG: hypothetical protein DHS80DRAFT_32327 [Piptocephalis tieghemiana]|nr:MAG: hypothetical protein DHS80DRAFT_32327 [Piptocephalis tieghemiana]
MSTRDTDTAFPRPTGSPSPLARTNQLEQERFLDRANDLGTNISLTQRALLNDASLGLYRVYENVKVQAPEMLSVKATMDKEHLKMDRAIATAEDLQKILANLHRCKSFNHVNRWLKDAIEDA